MEPQGALSSPPDEAIIRSKKHLQRKKQRPSSLRERRWLGALSLSGWVKLLSASPFDEVLAISWATPSSGDRSYALAQRAFTPGLLRERSV